METKFKEKFDFGKIAEKEVEEAFYSKGFHVIRSYDYQGEENNSPRMFALETKDNLILPDLDVSKDGKRIWVECKHYTATPFNRTYGINVHGIKKRHYKHYLKVQKITGNIVYLIIKEIQNNCLLYAKLDSLKTYSCLHIDQKCGDECLIYFNREDFKRFV